MTTEDPLAGLAEVAPGDLTRLRARLAMAAEAARLVDVAFRHLDSPVGPLLVAVADGALVRVSYVATIAGGTNGVLAELAEQVSPRVLHAPGRLDGVARELDEYFAGRRRRFEIPLDLRLASGFYRTVLDRLLDIGYGDTASYAAVAASAGSPRAVRAVGTACKENPLPVVVPCHRVVRSNGTMGGYAGGPAIKAHLLGLEESGGR